MRHSDNENYTPIDCALHSEYELAILQGRSLELCWQDDCGNRLKQQVKPFDIRARDKQEFLLVRNLRDVIYEIRLDKIIQSDVK